MTLHFPPLHNQSLPLATTSTPFLTPVLSRSPSTPNVCNFGSCAHELAAPAKVKEFQTETEPGLEKKSALTTFLFKLPPSAPPGPPPPPGTTPVPGLALQKLQLPAVGARALPQTAAPSLPSLPPAGGPPVPG